MSFLERGCEWGTRLPATRLSVLWETKMYTSISAWKGYTTTQSYNSQNKANCLGSKYVLLSICCSASFYSNSRYLL